MQEQAAQLRAQQDKLTALSRRVLRHKEHDFSRSDHPASQLSPPPSHKASSSAPIRDEIPSKQHEHVNAGQALRNSSSSSHSGFTVRRSSRSANATVQVAPDQGRPNSTGLRDNDLVHSCHADMNERVSNDHFHIRTAAEMHAEDVCKPRAHRSMQMRYPEDESDVAATATVASSANQHLKTFTAVPSYFAQAADVSQGVSQARADGAGTHTSRTAEEFNRRFSTHQAHQRASHARADYPVYEYQHNRPDASPQPAEPPLYGGCHPLSNKAVQSFPTPTPASVPAQAEIPAASGSFPQHSSQQTPYEQPLSSTAVPLSDAVPQMHQPRSDVQSAVSELLQTLAETRQRHAAAVQSMREHGTAYYQASYQPTYHPTYQPPRSFTGAFMFSPQESFGFQKECQSCSSQPAGFDLTLSHRGIAHII
jgi:hypothetical protein